MPTTGTTQPAAATPDPRLTTHLGRIHARCIDALVDEVKYTADLYQVYPEIGSIHPAYEREGHAQHLMSTALRSAGYYTKVETNYPNTMPGYYGRRKIDIAAWIPDVRRWLYLEIKTFYHSNGEPGQVIQNANGLISDCPSGDQLRGLLVYGFFFPPGSLKKIQSEVGRQEKQASYENKFYDKFDGLGAELTKLGFKEIAIADQDISGEWPYMQVGLWVIGA